MKTRQEVADFLGLCIAMDSSGEWYWHKGIPKIFDDGWISEYPRKEDDYWVISFCGLLPPDLIEYDGDWETSLTIPTGK